MIITEKYIDLDGQELTKQIIFVDSNNITIYEYLNKNGKLHRLDGPAVIYSDDLDDSEYWLEGKPVTKRDIDLIWLKQQTKD